jgi:DNA-binding transcriptional MocR family regulator
MQTDPTWQPDALGGGRPAYVALADAIAGDLAAGRLTPGDRLPTHRSLARALGVTVGTVARGYAEAERRGLVSGEVGRGTFVRAGFGVAAAGADLVDLASLHPPATGEVDGTERLAATLGALAADPAALRAVAGTEGSTDAPAHRQAAAAWAAHGTFRPDPARVLLTAGAQHALTLVLMALVPAGSAVATTPLTNPGLVAAARQLGVPLLAVDSDDRGMLPDALRACCAERAVAVVHLQPTLANPTGVTTPETRRRELAAVAEEAGLWVLEDDPLAPLVLDRPDPVAGLLPDRTCHVASAAKVLALGLRVGVLTAPETAYARLAAALRATTWLTSPLLAEVLARWVRDGTADAVAADRAAACRHRNARARALLGRLVTVGDPAAPHLWLDLPAPWSPGQAVAAAREVGVLVSPGDDFVIDRAQAAFGLRLGLNDEVGEERLSRSLVALARLLDAGAGTVPTA